MSRKKIGTAILSVAFGGAFVWLVLRQVTWAEIRGGFSGINWCYVGLALLALCLGYSCRIQRWRMMLRHENENLSWRACAGPLLASVAANNVLPFRIGDAVRAVGFNRHLGISISTSLSTLFAERMLDLMMVLLLLGGAVALLGPGSSQVVQVSGLVLVILGAIILGALFFPGTITPLLLIAGRLVARVAPRSGGRLLQELENGVRALRYISRWPLILRLVLWSCLAWLSEGVMFWLVALALPAIKESCGAWLAMPVGTLATVLPSPPGYVGTFDFFVVRAMTVMGNQIAAATAYALVVHVLLWLPITLAGGAYFLVVAMKRSPVKER